MASKRSQLPATGRISGLVSPSRTLSNRSVCLFCSLAPAGRTSQARRNRANLRQLRYQSTSSSPNSPRVELEQTLNELHRRYPNLIHVSRLQLALQGLRQEAGDEAVRIAVLGLASGLKGESTARRVLRVLLADPLKDEETWEEKLLAHDPTQPLIVRIDAPTASVGSPLTLANNELLPEIHVTSAELKNSKLELLLMDIDPMAPTPTGEAVSTPKEALLVPSVEIPDGSDRVTPVTTPVHKAILVADGLEGAIHISSLRLLGTDEMIRPAVNFEAISKEQLQASFDVFDITKAERSIQLFRQGPQHAMEYERLWSSSGVAELSAWLKQGVKLTDGTTKAAVRQLLTSILHDAATSLQETESGQVSKAFRSAVSSSVFSDVNEAVAEWSQKAHAELQSELDLAFTSRRWRKIGWWKLFWRVDDVAMLTNETLSRRFLPTAEQELVYLTGRIAELKSESVQYVQPTSSKSGPEDTRSLSLDEQEAVVPTTASTASLKWPGYIAFTRRYLQNETIPALQALAQKLVAQSIGTSSMAVSIAALLYVSSSVSTVYEAGAVAALGIVYSLGRMQKKWETARDFWEGEVREEGRKAVRAAEESVARELHGDRVQGSMSETVRDLEKARDLVTKAEDALARMK